MRYLSIFKAVERATPPTQEEMEAMGRLIEEFSAKGVLLATEGCLPSALGFRVRRDGGTVTVTDGPFTEAKEVLGGFAILAAASKEEALALTRRFLEVAGDGECEVRQLYEAPALGEADCAKLSAEAAPAQ
ncbi:MAG TPA: YciI family protein [Gemmatimonadales bacterium]|nr:YciI family protein [Gemmatimonadales bacterium]